MRPEIVLRHEFVEYIPSNIEEGVVYVSIPYATAVHKCCCGCATQVVTPLTPTDWKLIFDGDTISLDPSIGNWNFPCRSHYFIRRNRVKWAAQWSQGEIDANRAQDRLNKQQHFARKAPVTKMRQPSVSKDGFWRQLRKRWF